VTTNFLSIPIRGLEKWGLQSPCTGGQGDEFDFALSKPRGKDDWPKGGRFVKSQRKQTGTESVHPGYKPQ